MALKLYNTLSKKKEIFSPQNTNEVTMYVCGPTVYNYAHIGNARPAVVFDLLFRILLHLYPKVSYARNITDIDDKIINKANEENCSINKIAKEYYNIYKKDMATLHILTPTLEPWATKHIKDIIELIQKLIDRKYAYEAQGHVIFHVPSFSDYGILSQKTRKDILAKARIEMAPYKKDPSDFILWKAAKNQKDEGQIAWESPWGLGRPGWHIECSAMIAACFGTTIDIHGGGQDLMFPHHENEIAQSMAAHGNTELARFWIHNGFVNLNNEKISKSLNNTFLVHDILKKTQGESIRLALLCVHYRGNIEWGPSIIEQANKNLNRFYECLQKFLGPKFNSQNQLTSDIDTPTSIYNIDNKKHKIPSKFMEALEDDLNTSEAIAYMHHLRTLANTEKEKKMQIKYSLELFACGRLLGIFQQSPQSWFQIEKGNENQSISVAKIEELLEQRNIARKSGDFEKADEIRKILLKADILIKDNKGGSEWLRKRSF